MTTTRSQPNSPSYPSRLTFGRFLSPAFLPGWADLRFCLALALLGLSPALAPKYHGIGIETPRAFNPNISNSINIANVKYEKMSSSYATYAESSNEFRKVSKTFT